MQLKRVVVTGLGALTPIGNNVADYWNALLKGVSGASPITRFDASKLKTQFACEVKNYQAADHFDRKEARKFDLYSQYAIVAAREAITDAQLNMEAEDKDRIGVVLGVGIGGILSLEKEISDFAVSDGTPRFSPFFVTKMIANMASGHIAIEYGLHGPNHICTSACASSNTAIANAIDQIRLGRANVMITGGAEAPLCVSSIGGFNSMHALSTRNESPATASRPFSKSRDGFVMGEGAGCLVLEELEHALARGAKIYAEVAGVGMSADAHHITASHPEGLGAILAMQRALDDAQLTTNDIDYINVHGTSTPVGDVSEATAIVRLFGEQAYQLNISSTKSMTGHLMGAAGAIECIASVLAVKNNIVPPTINHADDDVDDAIDSRLNFTFNQPQERNIRAALSNTFGFGGQNASIIVKKYI